MKKIAFTILFAAVAVLHARAAVVQWNALEDNGFSLQGNADLPDNSFLRLGYFNFNADPTLNDAAILANQFSIAVLNANFIEFGNARIGDAVGDLAGHFSARSENNSSVALNLAGKQMYLWVFASTNNSSAANSINTAFQHGIFYMDKVSDADWAFPAQDPVPGTTYIDITDLTDASGANLVTDAQVAGTGAHIVVGGFGGDTSDATSAKNFTLQAVPEPSTAGLAIFGGLALLARRRRIS